MAYDYNIKPWFHKQIDCPQHYSPALGFHSEDILGETEKAYRVRLVAFRVDGEREMDLERWIPKSQVETPADWAEQDARRDAPCAAPVDLERIGKRWVPTSGQARYYVNGIKKEVPSAGDFPGMKVWVGEDDMEVHVDRCPSPAVCLLVREHVEGLIAQLMEVSE